MQVARFHEHGEEDVLTVEDIERPNPAAGEILVETEAIGVNHVDTLFRKGVFPPPGLPHIPGSDFAGIVTEVGEQVTEYEVGDRVNGAGLGGDRPGTYAEFVTAPVERVAHLPEAVSFDEGAAVGHVGVAAWQAVIHHGDLQAAETCLIHGGGGGLGHIAVQLAAASGGTVITTEAEQETRDRLLDLGADAAFDFRRDDLADAVLEVDQPDLIVDYHFDNYVDFDLVNIAHSGRISILEFTAEEGGEAVIGQSTLRQALLKDVTIQLIGIYNADISAVLQSLNKLTANGDLHVEVAGTYDLDDAAQAQHDIVEELFLGSLVLKP
jgi:NADPH2:quinone reductase